LAGVTSARIAIICTPNQCAGSVVLHHHLRQQ